MPPAPNNNPLEDIELDFTKPADKLANLKEKIAAAERGIILAESIGDTARADEMAKKKAGFEETLSLLKAQAVPKQEFWTSSTVDDDPFSSAVGRENGGALDKMDKRTGI